MDHFSSFSLLSGRLRGSLFRTKPTVKRVGGLPLPYKTNSETGGGGWAGLSANSETGGRGRLGLSANSETGV